MRLPSQEKRISQNSSRQRFPLPSPQYRIESEFPGALLDHIAIEVKEDQHCEQAADHRGEHQQDGHGTAALDARIADNPGHGGENIEEHHHQGSRQQIGDIEDLVAAHPRNRQPRIEEETTHWSGLLW